MRHRNLLLGAISAMALLTAMPAETRAASGTAGANYTWTTDIPANATYTTSVFPDYSYATGTTSSGGPCYGNASGNSYTCEQNVSRYQSGNAANPLRDTSGATVTSQRFGAVNTSAYGNYNFSAAFPSSQYFSFLIDWKTNKGETPTITVNNSYSFQLGTAAATTLADGTSAAWVNVAAVGSATINSMTIGINGMFGTNMLLDIGSVTYALPGGSFNAGTGTADVPEPASSGIAAAFGMLGLGILGMTSGRRRNRTDAQAS